MLYMPKKWRDNFIELYDNVDDFSNFVNEVISNDILNNNGIEDYYLYDLIINDSANEDATSITYYIEYENDDGDYDEIDDVIDIEFIENMNDWVRATDMDYRIFESVEEQLTKLDNNDNKRKNKSLSENSKKNNLRYRYLNTIYNIDNYEVTENGKLVGMAGFDNKSGTIDYHLLFDNNNTESTLTENDSGPADIDLVISLRTSITKDPNFAKMCNQSEEIHAFIYQRPPKVAQRITDNVKNTIDKFIEHKTWDYKKVLAPALSILLNVDKNAFINYNIFEEEVKNQM